MSKPKKKLDAMQAAALAMVSRPCKEVTPKRQLTDGHWAGMPEYQDGPGQPPSLIVRFLSESDRQEFVASLGVPVYKKTPRTWCIRWRDHEKRDTASLRFVEQTR